jgi:hypothetical protein
MFRCASRYNRDPEAVSKFMKKQTKSERPEKEKVTREEALKRVKAFGKRKEKLIAAIREGTHRDIHT